MTWTLLTAEAFGALRSLPDDHVYAVICDPPSSSGGAFRGDRTRSTTSKYVGNSVAVERPDFLGDTRDQRGHLTWSSLWLTECLRVSRAGAPVCVFTDWRQLPVTTDALQAAGWVWRGIVVWDKTEGVRPVLGRYRPQAEFVVWGSKGPMPVKPGLPALPGVYRFVSNGRRKTHIAEKPLELMRALVRICPPGGVVLDPFAGSGTTGVAALAEGRRFLGFELHSGIAEAARERLRGNGERAGLESSL